MMYNYAKLDGRIRERCGKRAIFASKMGLSEHSISFKMNGKKDFKQCEILKACEVLDIQIEDIGVYFFAKKVQQTEQKQGDCQ